MNNPKNQQHSGLERCRSAALVIAYATQNLLKFDAAQQQWTMHALARVVQY